MENGLLITASMYAGLDLGRTQPASQYWRVVRVEGGSGMGIFEKEAVGLLNECLVIGRF